MGLREFAYSWPGVEGTIEASSESAARAAIREKHNLKWVPNGATVVRSDARVVNPRAGPIVVETADLRFVLMPLAAKKEGGYAWPKF